MSVNTVKSGILEENEALRRENESLRARLDEALEVLQAIQEGQVDALVISGADGEHVFTLQGAEHPYRVLIEQMQEGAVTLVLDGKIYYANAAFARMLGRPLEEVIGSNVQEHLEADDCAQFDVLFRECQSGSARGELYLRCSDGSRLPAHIGLTSIVTEAGSSICMVITDLTEKKHVERILASEQQARAILNQAVDAIVVCDAEGLLIFANGAARKFFASELLPRQSITAASVWGDIYDTTGQSIPLEEWSLSKALRGEVTSGREARIVRQDGSHCDILVGAAPLRDGTGEIIGAVASLTDIADRKRAEETLAAQNQALQDALEELRATQEEIAAQNEEIAAQNDELAAGQAALQASKERLQRILSTITEGYYVLDEKWRFVEINAAAEQHFGRPAGELLGTNIWEETGTPPMSLVYEKFHEAAESKKPMHFEAKSAMRGCVWSDMHVYLQEGRLEVYFHDITDRKKLEEQLRAAMTSAERAKAAAEEANQAKDQFLAVLSHELRTPLTPVLAAAQLMQRDKDLPEQMRQHLDIMSRNLALEARLIDDLLDLTRVVQGKVLLDRKVIDLRTVLERAAGSVISDINARKLHLDLELDEVPHPVSADASRLHQIFSNLLSNAIKFTNTGGHIGIRCYRRNSSVIVEVRDTGMGIDAEILPRIFNAFEQGDARVTRQFGGLGLGLAISKRLVELHGGTISAESGGKNQGATFSVELPIERGGIAAETGKAPATHDAASMRVLLVEDHDDTTTIMRMLLESVGYEVATVRDVEQALIAAGTTHFNLVISDLGLPDRSGFELMQELRSRGSTVKGIALSGYGREEDRRRSLEAGFSAHLIKPVDFDVLIDTVRRITSERLASSGN